MANVFANTYSEPDYGVDDHPHVMTKHLQHTFAGTAAVTWQAGTPYTVGNIMVPTAPNGHYYRCKVAGTSAAVTEPTWGTIGGDTADGAGTLVWTDVGSLANTVYIGQIPSGAYIMKIKRKSVDLTTNAATIDVGYSNDTTTAATAFGSAIDISTAALAVDLLNFAPLKVTRKTDIIVTAATSVLSGQLDLIVTYRDDGVGTRDYL